ncbi:MAG: hypothetical protein WA821_03340 [Anaerolineales bacterium]
MSTSEDRLPTFSSDAIRLFIGLIAFALPLLVTVASSFAPLTSISASYNTGARDIFVGLLFVLGAFLFTYKGHEKKEDWMANLAALGAILAALCPIPCDACKPDTAATIKTIIHCCGGLTMFSVIAYFCLGPFRKAAKVKPGNEAGRRVRFYTFCGWAVIACIAVIIVGTATAGFFGLMPTFTFLAEFVMLWLFSAAWLVASQWLPWFTDKSQRLDLAQELELKK